MEFTKDTAAITNLVRHEIQERTQTISQGEAVAISAWWSFICDHARCMGHDPHTLAREQLDAFLVHSPIKIVQQH